MTNEHFGNPLIEQRKLLAGEAAVEFTDQSVIELKGEDAKSWLHSLVSQNVQGLQEGGSTESLLLDPQGHIEQQLKIIYYQASLWLIVPQYKSEALLNWLRKMIFRSKVEITDRTQDFKVLGTFKDLALPAVWLDPWSAGSLGGHRYGQPRPFDYREYLVPVDFANPLESAGLMAIAALRIYAGRPSISDVDDKSLPHEFDWLASAVHLSKGCYRGQESVAKIHNLGHPPRRLVLLHLDSSEMLPQPGSEVLLGDQVKGRVCASANHFEAGAIALALISRLVPVDAVLGVRTDNSILNANQEVLVPPAAGSVAPRPSLPKLKLGSK